MAEVFTVVLLFLLLLFLLLSTGAFWLGVYDRGKQRQGNR